MLFAFAVDLALYAAAGFAVAHFAKRWLPGPLKDWRLTTTLFVIIGTFITMATFQNWIVYPR